MVNIRGMKLADYLADQKITQTDFARRIGVSNSMLSSLLNGIRRPGFDTIQAIAQATENAVRPDDWFDLPLKTESDLDIPATPSEAKPERAA